MSLLKKKRMAGGGAVANNEDSFSVRGVHPAATSLIHKGKEQVAGRTNKGGTSVAGFLAKGASRLRKEGSPGVEHTEDVAQSRETQSKAIHSNKREELKSMAGPTSGVSGFADGGEVDCPDCCDGMPCEMHGEQGPEHEEDMVSKIMGKRMAKGGMAEAASLADSDPNEFDELEVNPPPMDNSSAGNEHGDSTLFEDAVSKVMMKRKSQHNPRPA